MTFSPRTSRAAFRSKVLSAPPEKAIATLLMLRSISFNFTSFLSSNTTGTNRKMSSNNYSSRIVTNIHLR
jgi:hypothetical protein